MGKPDIRHRNVAFGDPTQANGAGMLDLKTCRRVVRSMATRKKMPKDNFGNNKPADGIILGSNGTVAIDVPREVGTSLKRFLAAFAADGTFRARGSQVPHRSLALINPDAIEGAADHELTDWYHSIDDVDIPDLENNTDDGDADEQFVTVTFSFGYADETQGGTPIPEELQPFCAGDKAAAANLGYSLPADYDAAA